MPDGGPPSAACRLRSDFDGFADKHGTGRLIKHFCNCDTGICKLRDSLENVEENMDCIKTLGIDAHAHVTKTHRYLNNRLV